MAVGPAVLENDLASTAGGGADDFELDAIAGIASDEVLAEVAVAIEVGGEGMDAAAVDPEDFVAGLEALEFGVGIGGDLVDDDA